MIDLKKGLLNKLRLGKLPHFFILSAKGSNSAKLLDEWIKSFLAEFISSELPSHNFKKSLALLDQGHPDLLIIKNPEKSHYSMKDLGILELFKFIEYRPYLLSHKFIIIYDSHCLGPILLNKLLKTIEAPEDNTTFFFLDPRGSRFLPTIESRAIRLDIPITSRPIVAAPHNSSFKDWVLEQTPSDQSKNFFKILNKFSKKEISFFELLEKCKSSKKDHDIFPKVILDWALSSTNNKHITSKLIQDLKWYQKSGIYNNASVERYHTLFPDS